MFIHNAIDMYKRYNKFLNIPLKHEDEFYQNALSTNLSRAKVFLYIIVLRLILSLLIDIFIYRKEWIQIPAYKNLFYIHIIAIVIFTVFFYLFHNYNKRGQRLNGILHYTFTILFLLINEAVSINAQLINGLISTYVIALFAVSVLIICNNIESLIIIPFSYITFILGLIIIQNDTIKLIGNITNSITLLVCAFVASRICYFMYVRGFLVNKDITDKTKDLDNLNVELNEKNKQLETILENMSDALAIIDRNGKYIKVNKALKEIIKNTGMCSALENKGDTIKAGTKYYDEFDNNVALEDMPFSRVINGELVDKKKIIIDQGSKPVYIEMSAIPIFDDNGSFQFGIVNSRDITAREEYYKLLEAQQRSALRSEIDRNNELEKI